MAEFAERVARAFDTPLVTGTRQHRVRISIGVAVYPRGGTTLEQLMLSADTALYTAKANGRNQVVSLE